VAAVLPRVAPTGSRWAWWVHLARTDPADFEAECVRLLAERDPCPVCHACGYVAAPYGSIVLAHDRYRHHADRDWQPPRPTSYRSAAPARRPRDPLEDS
jgi:hypothetical protein